MAELKNAFFELKGTVGNLVFKTVEGKQIVQTAPFGRTIVSEKVKRNITRFTIILAAYSGIFGTKILHGSSNLKKLWRNSYTRRIALNTFFLKKNYECIMTLEDMPNLIMSPTENPFNFPVSELKYENDSITLVMEKLDASMELNPDTENYIEATGFVCMTEPAHEGLKPIDKSHIQSTGIHRIQYDQEIIFNLHTGIKNDLPRYNKMDIYLVLITLTEKDTPVRTSVKKIFTLVR